MDLWIRSQDKLKLTKIDYLYVDKLNASDLDNRYEVEAGNLTLGIYKTKERALEVLDEVQNKLNIRHSSGASAEFIVLSEIAPRIYEMPEE